MSALQLGFKGEKFIKEIYLKGAAAVEGGDGSSYKSALPLVDGDLLAIPAGAVIEKCYVIVDTAVTGTSAFELGDDDDADGFVKNASVTLGTPGMYGWDAKAAGAYLRIETAGATDAADIYVVPSAKYYSAAGKELKLNVTGTNTAGEVRVVLEGYMAKQ